MERLSLTKKTVIRVRLFLAGSHGRVKVLTLENNPATMPRKKSKFSKHKNIIKKIQFAMNRKITYLASPKISKSKIKMGQDIFWRPAKRHLPTSPDSRIGIGL